MSENSRQNVAIERFRLSELDAIDWELLCILNDEPLWKRKAHDRLGRMSVQTVGRRITRLQERGLLEPRLLSPDDLKRNLIIGYMTTDTATRLLEEIRICRTCHKMEDTVDHHHTFVPVKNCFQDH